MSMWCKQMLRIARRLSSMHGVALMAMASLLAGAPQGQEEAAAELPALRGFGAMSPAGAELALIAEDGRVLVLDIASGRVRLSVPAGEEGAPRDLCWSPDGARLAILSSTRHVRILSAVDGTVQTSFATERREFEAKWVSRGMQFAAGGDVIVLAHGGSTAEIRSSEDGKLRARIGPSGENPATAEALSHDGELLALGDREGNVAVWETRSGKLRHGPKGVGAWVEDLDFHPSGSALAIGTRDCEVRLWRFEEPAELRRLSHCDQDIFGGLAIGYVRFSPDGRRLLATSWLEARLWDLEADQELRRYGYGGGNQSSPGGSFSREGSRLVLILGGVVLDENGNVERRLLPHGEKRTWMASDGTSAWSVHGGRLRVYSVADGSLLLDLPVAQ